MARLPVYPNHVLADACRATGANVRLLWEERGPKNTLIAFLSCYQIGKGVCIVQSYVNGGWEVFTPSPQREVAAVVADVLNRCGVPAPVAT